MQLNSLSFLFYAARDVSMFVTDAGLFLSFDFLGGERKKKNLVCRSYQIRADRWQNPDSAPSATDEKRKKFESQKNNVFVSLGIVDEMREQD